MAEKSVNILSPSQNAVKDSGLPAKPFLKWAGGKGQLLGSFIDFYPPELKSNKLKNYFEPFVGGGAVFFDIAQKFDINSAFLFDINDDLILTYRVVQQDVLKLTEQLDKFSKKYLKLDEIKQHELYYKTREKFNSERRSINYRNYSDKWIKRAAQIIFMNKTCFNGLFRFNLKGEFNVPVGRYKNPKILNAQNLAKVSSLLAIAEIRKAEFKEVTSLIKPSSFVYFDPPYRPLNKTSGFTSYSQESFSDAEQKELATVFAGLDKKGYKLMLSNSDPKNFNPHDNFFDELYAPFQISRIPARRSINSNGAKRSAINELIVTNYVVNPTC